MTTEPICIKGIPNCEVKPVISFKTESLDKEREVKRICAHLENLYTRKDTILFFQNHTRSYLKCSINLFLHILKENNFTEDVSISTHSFRGNSFRTITVRINGDNLGETSLLSVPTYACGRFIIGSTFIIKEEDWDLHKQDIASNLKIGRDRNKVEEEEEEPTGRRGWRPHGEEEEEEEEEEELLN